MPCGHRVNRVSTGDPDAPVSDRAVLAAQPVVLLGALAAAWWLTPMPPPAHERSDVFAWWSLVPWMVVGECVVVAVVVVVNRWRRVGHSSLVRAVVCGLLAVPPVVLGGAVGAYFVACPAVHESAALLRPHPPGTQVVGVRRTAGRASQRHVVVTLRAPGRSAEALVADAAALYNRLGWNLVAGDRGYWSGGARDRYVLHLRPMDDGERVEADLLTYNSPECD
jgi:hypothetical protein